MKSLTTLDVKNNPTTRISVGSAFIIQNATGSNLAVIDAVGNMDISKIAIIYYKLLRFLSMLGNFCKINRH